MPTRLVSLAAPEQDIIAEAAAHLRAGRLVAFPTETVYGLGANALDPEAVARIYAAKGRPAYNPLIVHVADAADVMRVAASWPAAASVLAEAFWPGPLTLVVPKHARVPDGVSAGLSTVGIRVPAHPVAHALLGAAGVPVAAPSANRSMELSPTRAQHVERALGTQVAMILDGGPTLVGIESTVVDVSGEHPLILRPGGLSRRAIEEVVGPVGIAGAAPAGDTPRASPGMLDRHYAPRARLVVFAAPEAAEVASRLGASREGGGLVGALVHSPAGQPVADVADAAVVLTADAGAYAAHLYAALHELDDAGCEVVAVEAVPGGMDWEGVRDRLVRASRESPA